MNLIRTFIFILFLVSSISLMSCQKEQIDEVEKETTESFVTEETELNNEGYYEAIGYTKVNSITYIKDNKHIMITHVQSIEDHHDLDGNYIKTLIIDNYYEKLKINESVSSYNHILQTDGPLTIHVPDEFDSFSTIELSEDEL